MSWKAVDEMLEVGVGESDMCVEQGCGETGEFVVEEKDGCERV